MTRHCEPPLGGAAIQSGACCAAALDFFVAPLLAMMVQQVTFWARRCYRALRDPCALVLVALLAGCATTPDATYTPELRFVYAIKQLSMARNPTDQDEVSRVLAVRLVPTLHEVTYGEPHPCVTPRDDAELRYVTYQVEDNKPDLPKSTPYRSALKSVQFRTIYTVSCSGERHTETFMQFLNLRSFFCLTSDTVTAGFKSLSEAPPLPDAFPFVLFHSHGSSHTATISTLFEWARTDAASHDQCASQVTLIARR